MAKVIRNLLLMAGCFVAIAVSAQNKVAHAKFNFPYHNPQAGWPGWPPNAQLDGQQATPFNVTSNAGTVCDNNTPTVINYNDFYNRSIENEYSLFTPDTAGKKLYDSAGIENLVKSVPANKRFKAEAGKPFKLSIELFIGTEAPGNWHNVNTWDAKRVPQATDDVIINNHHKVEFPASMELKCTSVTLQPGANLVLPKTSKLTVKSL